MEPHIRAGGRRWSIRNAALVGAGACTCALLLGAWTPRSASSPNQLLFEGTLIGTVAGVGIALIRNLLVVTRGTTRETAAPAER
jgi:hypothetical protein